MAIYILWSHPPTYANLALVGLSDLEVVCYDLKLGSGCNLGKTWVEKGEMINW